MDATAVAQRGKEVRVALTDAQSVEEEKGGHSLLHRAGVRRRRRDLCEYGREQHGTPLCWPERRYRWYDWQVLGPCFRRRDEKH